MTALTEAQAALTALQASQAYQQYKANGTLARTKLGSCEQHLLTCIADLQPPPLPSNQPWAWDATKATVLPNSAALITDWLAHGFGSGASFSCDVAVSETGRPGDPPQATYTVTGGKVSNYDIAVYAQAGVKAGVSSDHHLVLRDHLRGKEHDFWEAAPSGQSIGSGGGGSFPLDAAQEPIGEWSNAARFPLERTAIRADEVKAGRIPHALEFSAVWSWIGGPSVYPADGTSSGPGHGFPFGQWLRLDPAADISGLTGLDRTIAQALKDYGMFLRDGGSELDMSGIDYVNQGGNTAVWGDAGVTLTGSPYPWHRGLGAIPWNRMQALAPPVKA